MAQALDYYNQALSLWISALDKRGQAMTLTAIGRLSLSYGSESRGARLL